MPINTSFLTVFILSFLGIRQAYCPYAFRFSEIFQKNPLLFFEVEEWKREKKKERKREKRERERRKIGEIGEIRPIRKS